MRDHSGVLNGLPLACPRMKGGLPRHLARLIAAF